jgi:hypothetical protein
MEIMTLKSLLSPIVAVLAILVGGFVLFNLAFMVYALGVNWPQIMTGNSAAWVASALPALGITIGMAILIGIAVWVLVEKKLRKPTLYATLLTVPLMTLLVWIGITLYGQSDLVIAMAGAAVILPILAVCLWKKLPWVYPLAVTYVGVLGILIMVFDVQI